MLIEDKLEEGKGDNNMVTVKYKFHAHGKKGKWFTQNVRTYKEAKEMKKALSPKDKIIILSRGKPVNIKKVNKPRKRKSYNQLGFYDSDFSYAFPKFKI